jgi:hypothetical protein
MGKKAWNAITDAGKLRSAEAACFEYYEGRMPPGFNIKEWFNAPEQEKMRENVLISTAEGAGDILMGHLEPIREEYERQKH